jgi:hypothetical protein
MHRSETSSVSDPCLFQYGSIHAFSTLNLVRAKHCRGGWGEEGIKTTEKNTLAPFHNDEKGSSDAETDEEG